MTSAARNVANDGEPPPALLTVESTVEASGWAAAMADAEGFAATVCEAAWNAVQAQHGGDGIAAEISIFWTDDAGIRALNKQYRHQDKPTNVLSFPLYGGWDVIAPVAEQVSPVALGDIILALETITREAREQGKRFEAHLAHLLVHGVLHLCGYDHEDDCEAEAMEALETEILAGLGYPAPYQPAPYQPE